MQHLARRGLLAGLAAGAVCGPARAAITGLVAVGREGWLFPIWDEVRSVDLKRVAQVGAVCGAAAELLTKANIQVVFALTPVKSRVYRAFLPDDFSFGADPERRYATAIETLQRIAFAPDLLAPIVAERDANKTEPAFFKGDTHWTAAGAQATAAELARQIDIHYQAPASSQPGTALATPTVSTWERNDLADLLPPPQNAAYPPEAYRVRLPATGQGAAGLLEDAAADVAVVGNSFMQPRLGFASMLSNKLNRPVSLFWKVHQYGPYQTLLGYLASDTFRRRRPALIVWNMHETDMTVMPDRHDGWGQNAMSADSFLARLKQATIVALGRPVALGRAPGRDRAMTIASSGATGAMAMVAMLAAIPPASAQGQVYDPLPPPGSAYVRFVNASAEDVVLQSGFVAEQRLGVTGAQRVTAYFVVENVAGKRLDAHMRAGANAGEVTFSADPGSFNTVLIDPAGPPGQALRAVLVVDQTDFNQSRARLSFYNATTGCGSAALAIMPDGPAVFQDLAPGTAKARSVNPVTAAVKASCTGQEAAPFDLKDLEAGGMYSIWLMQSGDGIMSFLTRDATAKWKR